MIRPSLTWGFLISTTAPVCLFNSLLERFEFIINCGGWLKLIKTSWNKSFEIRAQFFLKRFKVLKLDEFLVVEVREIPTPPSSRPVLRVELGNL